MAVHVPHVQNHWLSTNNVIHVLYSLTWPVTITERSKACTVFTRSEAGILGSNPTRGMDIWCVCAFLCVCVVLCLDRGLATSWSPVQGVLPTVKWSRNWEISPMLQSGSKRKKNSLISYVKPSKLALFCAEWCDKWFTHPVNSIAFPARPKHRGNDKIMRPYIKFVIRYNFSYDLSDLPMLSDCITIIADEDMAVDLTE
jgi:hypothetical protein